MGEVYRAHDSSLNRDVANKVLLASVADDPDRLARFRREAQVLASLNHPNIAHIHGLEDYPVDGGSRVRALVMELDLDIEVVPVGTDRFYDGGGGCRSGVVDLRMRARCRTTTDCATSAARREPRRELQN